MIRRKTDAVVYESSLPAKDADGVLKLSFYDPGDGEQHYGRGGLFLSLSGFCIWEFGFGGEEEV